MSTNTTTPPEITAWSERPGGGRARGFEVRGCNVLVTPSGGDRDAEAAQLALELAAASVEITARWDDLISQRDAARRNASERLDRQLAAEQRIPPPAPARMLGPGCVRFDPATGEPWLLNKRESGWSSWGVRCESWDDLFRRYDVRITSHGTDEHGPWWIAEPGGLPATAPADELAARRGLMTSRRFMHHRRYASGRRTCDLDGQNPAANEPGHDDTHDPTCVDCPLCIEELKARNLLPESRP